jgi:hypothetical protein
MKTKWYEITSLKWSSQPKFLNNFL